MRFGKALLVNVTKSKARSHFTPKSKIVLSIEKFNIVLRTSKIFKQLKNVSIKQDSSPHWIPITIIKCI